MLSLSDLDSESEFIIETTVVEKQEFPDLDVFCSNTS